MIAEQRAVTADLHARATFTKGGEQVRETRGLIADVLPKPAPTEQQREVQTIRSASRMARAFDDGFVEVG